MIVKAIEHTQGGGSDLAPPQVVAIDLRQGKDQFFGQLTHSATKVSEGLNSIRVDIPLSEDGTAADWLEDLFQAAPTVASFEAAVSKVEVLVNGVTYPHVIKDESTSVNNLNFYRKSFRLFPMWQLNSVNGSELDVNNEKVSSGYTFKVKITFTAQNTVYQGILEKTLAGPDGVAAIRRRRIPERPVALENIKSYIPRYTKAHSDRYSKFQQVLTPFGSEMDRARERAFRVSAATSHLSARPSEADWLFQYPLSLTRSEQFKTGVSSEGRVFKIPPQKLTGQIGYNQLSVHYAETAGELISRDLPTRISVERLADNISPYVVASTPLMRIDAVRDIEVKKPGRLFIKFHSIKDAVKLDKTAETLETTTVKIKGEDPAGRAIEERLPLTGDTLIMTRNLWRSFSLELCSAAATTEGEVQVLAMPVEGSYLSEDFSYELREDGTLIPDAWSLESAALSAGAQAALSPDLSLFKTRKRGHISLLERKTRARGKLLDTIEKIDSTVTRKKHLLMDVNTGASSGTAGRRLFISGLGLAGKPESPDLYVIDHTHLYLYSKREELPGVLKLDSDGNPVPFLSLAKADTPSPEAGFFVQELSDVTVEFINNSFDIKYDVSIEYDTPREQQTVLEWSWSVIRPDGTEYFLNDYKGESSTEFWNQNPTPVDFYGIKDRNFDLVLKINSGDLSGLLDPVTKVIRKHFILKLRSRLADGTVQTTCKVVALPILQPRASFRYARPWAEEDLDFTSTPLALNKGEFRLQPRVEHAQGNILAPATLTTTGSWEDVCLAFDVFADESLTILVSNSAPHSSQDNNAGVLSPAFSSLYRVNFHYDYYTCDFDRDEIILREKYDNIIIDLSGG